MSETKLVDLIQKQIIVEESFVKTADKLMEQVHNVAARLLLMEMQKDSEKHAMILRGILDVIKQKKTAPLWAYEVESYVDKEVVRREIERHIQTETSMLNQVKEEMKETRDEGIRLLLEHIGDDEEKHHKILEAIIAQYYKLKP